MSLINALTGRCCPVCGGNPSVATLFLDRSIDESKLTLYSFASRKSPEFMSFRLVRCAICSTVYASEAPNADFLAGVYREASYDSAEEARSAAGSYADALAPYLDRLRRRGVALEVGAGTGAFLERLRYMDFGKVLGIEPSAAAIAAADPEVRPMIREGIFVGDEFPAGSVSLVCCFQTLEHVADPHALTVAAYRLLEPGGMIAVVSHDYTAPINQFLGRRSPIIDIEHLQLFAPKSLRHLLGEAGFSDIDIAPIANTYALRYWLRLLPVPLAAKHSLGRAATALGVDRARLRFRIGNILSIGVKPHDADP